MNIYLAQIVILFAVSITEYFTRVSEESRKHLFYFCAILLFSVLFFRYYRIGSDLGRYHTHFVTFGRMSISQIITIEDIDNIGFYLFTSFVYKICRGNYQMYVAIVSCLSFCPVIRMIKKTVGYSSTALYIYAGMGFYCFIFSGLKQAIAMGILCYALIAIFENKRVLFYMIVIVASFFHLPAIVFLPAYELTHISRSYVFSIGTVVVFILLSLFRDQFVLLLSETYDSVVEFERDNNVGGMVILKLIICVYGYLFFTPNNDLKTSNYLFRLMVVATVIQTLTVYGNVFERLADYYFVYVAIYLPQIFSVINENNDDLMKNINNQSLLFEISIFIVLALVLLYFIIYYKDAPGMLPYRPWELFW